MSVLAFLILLVLSLILFACLLYVLLAGESPLTTHKREQAEKPEKDTTDEL